jgi:hypothetical protein
MRGESRLYNRPDLSTGVPFRSVGAACCWKSGNNVSQGTNKPNRISARSFTTAAVLGWPPGTESSAVWGLDVATAWRIAAVAAGKLSLEYSTPARIRTRGFCKSAGLMVTQNAVIPSRKINPWISERNFTFWEKDPGTCMPMVTMFCCSRRMTGSSIFWPAASAFAAFCSWSSVRESISRVADLQW